MSTEDNGIWGGWRVRFLEATDQLAQERLGQPAAVMMLLCRLRALPAHDAPLLVPAFFSSCCRTRVPPVVRRVRLLQRPVRVGGLRLGRGGLLRVLCAGRSDAVAVSPAAIDLVRRVLGGYLSGALGVPAGPSVLEVERLATWAMEHHLERRPRSLPVAGTMAAD